MKKVYLSILSVLLSAIFAAAQESDSGIHVPAVIHYPKSENFIRTYSFTAPQAAEYNITEEVFDSLGRKRVIVKRDYSPIGTDVFSSIIYDKVGREWKTTLPLPTGCENDDTIYGEKRPFSEIVYEASPLNRKLREYGPGHKWRFIRKGIRTSYNTNSATGLLKCYHLEYVSSGNVSDPTVIKRGVQTPGTLCVTLTTDEDGRSAYTFKDESECVLLTRQILGGEALDTYMVYDDKRRLVAVLPPMLSNTLAFADSLRESNADMARYAYLYRYDERDRCVAKKLPGCGWTYYIYDKGDRLVFTQDAEDRKLGRWLFSFLDIKGRESLNGACRESGEHLRQMASSSNIVASRYYGSSGPYMGYSVSGVSLTYPDILSVFYYDDYSYLDGSVSGVPAPYLQYSERCDSLYGIARWDYVQGQLTGKAERILGEGLTNNFKWSSYYYDKKGNVIQSHDTRQDGGVDVTTTEVTFTGKPKRVCISHKGGILEEFYEYTYDQWERLLKVRHKLGNADEWTTLSDIQYDAIGRVASDRRTGNPDLKTTFAYNVRSWNTSMTGPGLSEAITYEPALVESGYSPKPKIPIGADSPEDEQITVPNQPDIVLTSPEACINASIMSENAEWGGNITSVEFTYDSLTYKHTYTYDDLSRLVTASTELGDDTLLESYSYDNHTNIVSYSKQGIITGGRTMSYDGNRMTSVSYSNDTRPGLINYDSVGRIVFSNIEGMTQVRYNHVGLPSYMSLSGGAYVHNTYTAGGVRLESRRTDASGSVTRMTYEGNEVIENGTLRMLLFDGGYIAFGQGSPRYCWYTKDHLGSIRAVADSTGTILARNFYGPYGKEFAAGEITGDDTPVGLGDGPGFGDGSVEIGNEGIFNPDDKLPDEGGHRPRPGHGETPMPPFTHPSQVVPTWPPFKFSGKESLARVGLDLYDFGARMYTPSNMRWLTMDPLCEKYYSISPYVYCKGNPINRIDPNGKDDYTFNNEGYYEKEENDDPYDRLIFADGATMIVKDKTIMASIQEHKYDLGEKGNTKLLHYAIVEKESEELYSVFRALSTHTNVEWGVFVNSKGQALLGTQHRNDGIDENAIAFWSDRGEKNIFDNLRKKIHSHPPEYETEVKSMEIDLKNAKNNPGTKSYVFFPVSGNTYYLPGKSNKPQLLPQMIQPCKGIY